MTVQATNGKTLTPFGEAVEADPRGRIAISHAIGVDPSTLWRWMTGRSRPGSVAAQRQAALALGVDVDLLWPDLHGAQPDADAATSDAAHRKAA